jgi:hypothetical protein
MKLLINKIFNNKIIKNIRNFIGFKPVHMSIDHIYNASSVSDAFCWRTDNNYTTTFKFSDLMRLFYDIDNSHAEIIFFDKNYNLIKKINYKNLDISNELNISKSFLNNIEDYGTFYIFHKSNKKVKENFIIANRCYIGFSYKNNLRSFVHGNTLASYQTIYADDIKNDIVKTTYLFEQNYRVQNYFDHMTKTELFFANPTNKKIKFSVNDTKYTLNVGCSIIINLNSLKTVNIISNCSFLRPIIFNYKNEFIDVYHG